MRRSEIVRLMKLRGWTQRDLARNLELTSGAVSRWLSGDSVPMGPARVLMRLWLKQPLLRPPVQ